MWRRRGAQLGCGGPPVYAPTLLACAPWPVATHPSRRGGCVYDRERAMAETICAGGCLRDAVRLVLRSGRADSLSRRLLPLWGEAVKWRSEGSGCVSTRSPHTYGRRSVCRGWLRGLQATGRRRRWRRRESAARRWPSCWRRPLCPVRYTSSRVPFPLSPSPSMKSSPPQRGVESTWAVGARRHVEAKSSVKHG